VPQILQHQGVVFHEADPLHGPHEVEPPHPLRPFSRAAGRGVRIAAVHVKGDLDQFGDRHLDLACRGAREVVHPPRAERRRDGRDRDARRVGRVAQHGRHLRRWVRHLDPGGRVGKGAPQGLPHVRQFAVLESVDVFEPQGSRTDFIGASRAGIAMVLIVERHGLPDGLQG